MRLSPKCEEKTRKGFLAKGLGSMRAKVLVGHLPQELKHIIVIGA